MHKVWLRITLVLSCMTIHPVLGYPASDAAVYNFFSGIMNRRAAFLKSHAFLASLFLETKKVVGKLSEDMTGQSRGKDASQILSEKFREYMTRDQNMQTHNVNRVEFFKTVTERASEVFGSLYLAYYS